MLDVPDDREPPDDVIASPGGAAPELDAPVGRGTPEDTEDTTPEEAGYGYGV